jgi:hypothetical protein
MRSPTSSHDPPSPFPPKPLFPQKGGGRKHKGTVIGISRSSINLCFCDPITYIYIYGEKYEKKREKERRKRLERVLREY